MIVHWLRHAGDWVRTHILRRKLWMVVHVDDGTHHCYPLHDHVTHTADQDCICGPRTEYHQDDDGDDLWIVIHHSLDGREHHEPARHQ